MSLPSSSLSLSFLVLSLYLCGETESFLILDDERGELLQKEGSKVPRFATMSRKMSFNSRTPVKNIPKVSSRSRFCLRRMQKKSDLSRLSRSRRCFVSATSISASFAFVDARRNFSATQKVEIPPPSSSASPGWAPYVGARGLVTEAPVVARYPDEFRTSLNETFFKLPLSEQSIMAEYVWIGGSVVP